MTQSTFQVANDLNAIMNGTFSEKDTKRYQKFELNLKNFHAIARDLIDTQVNARLVCFDLSFLFVSLSRSIIRSLNLAFYLSFT